MTVHYIDNIGTYAEAVSAAKQVLLEFGADWCSPCKAMRPILEDFAKNNPEIIVCAVDVEGSGLEDILGQYKVRSLPTFIHLENGAETSRIIGTAKRNELTELVKRNK